MSVICAACNTENRDNAMFCRGCAGKLPGFAANGPAASDIMKPLRTVPAATAGRTGTSQRGLLQIQSRAFWLRLGLLALGITIGFVAWYVHVTRRTAPPVPAVTAAAPAKPAPATPVQSATTAAPPVRTPVPMAETLAPGETLAPSGVAATTAATATATATMSASAGAQQLPPPVAIEPRNEANRREALAARQRTDPFQTADAPPTRTASTSDPRPGCAHLNFIAAARCEAAQCQRAPYRTHPHCDAVREQTRRDVARRNMPN